MAVAVLLGAGIGAYWNSFAGQFVFDDHNAIIDNPSITTLRDLGKVLRPPRDLSTSGRPLLNLTLAINYAIGGTEDTWSYHAVNLAIHVLAALALMGVVRRTLLSPPLRGRFGRAALPLAAAVALLWMLHPLQVQAVTYVTQRAESMVSLMYLLTLYCTIRSTGPSAARLPWQAAAVLACAAGMACKEVMVTAPVTVLVYDRLFLAGGWRRALARRRWLYAGLAATWLILAGLMWTNPRSASAGFGLAEVTPLRYAATEFGVILYYLRLAVWPSPLVADYAWPWAKSLTAVLPEALAVGALVAGTCWLLWRGRPLAMAGVWFFLILAPTSSVMPILAPIFEYHLYLALAAIVAVAVLGGYRLLVTLGHRGQPAGKTVRATLLAGALAVGAPAATLGWLTHQRNKVYASEAIFWQDVVDKQPKSWRGHNGLGNALLEAGKIDQAIEHYRTALQIEEERPYRDTVYSLALALFQKGQHTEAEQYTALLLASYPTDVDGRMLKGTLALVQGKSVEAQEVYARVLQTDPNHVNAIVGLANAYLAQGRTAEAKAVLAQVPAVPPDPQTALMLAKTHTQLGDVDAAIATLRGALKRHPTTRDVPVMMMLGTLYSQVGDLPRAIESLTQAAALAATPGHRAAANRELGLRYAQMGQFPQAEQAYLSALEADGTDPSTLNNLAYLYANNLHQPDKALLYATQAVRIAPDSAEILDTLGWALAKNGQLTEAERHLTKALHLSSAPLTIAEVDYHLGWIREHAGRRGEAAEHYRHGLKALEGRQDVPVHKDLTEALDRVQKGPTPKR